MTREFVESQPGTRVEPEAHPAQAPYPSDLADFVLEASVGVVLLDPDGTIRWANRIEHERLGLSREEFVGRPYADFFFDRRDGEEILARIFQRQTLRNQDVTLRDKRGAPRFIALDGEAVRRGSEAHARLLTRDLTDEKRIQEASRLQAHMLNAVGQAVIGTDPNGTVTYWNRAAETLYGWPADEAIGKPIFELTVSESGQDAARSIMEAISAGETWSGEFEVRRRDGSTFSAYVTDTPLFDESGHLMGLVGVSTDISALKAAQSALGARQRRLEAMADSLPALIAMVSQRQGFYYFNRALIEFTGYRPASGPISWSNFVHEEDLLAVRDGFQTVLRGHTMEREARMRRHDGLYRWFLVRAVPLAPTEGEPGTAVISAVDVTDMKLANQEVESARAQLATVLGGIADGVVAQDASGSLVYANDAAARLIGYEDAAALMSANAGEILQPFDIEGADGNAIDAIDLPGQQALRGIASEDTLVKFKRKDSDEVRYSVIKATPVYDGQGRVEYGVSIFREVTQQVQAEQEREELLRREHDARLAAEKASGRLARLQSVTARLASAWTPAEAADAILDQTVDLLQASAGAVMLLDDDGGKLSLIASRGYSEDKVEAWNQQHLTMPRPFNDAVTSGEPVFIDTREEFVERYPEFAAALRDINASTACVPLRAGGRIMGALSLGFARDHAIESLDRAFIRSVAQQCALALARTQLYESERTARTQAQDAEARYRILAESVPQIVFTSFPDGTVDYYSPQFFSFTGLSRDEVEASDWHGLVHPEDVESVRQAWAGSIDSGEPVEVEARIRKMDGAFCWILERAVALKDADDKVVRWLGTITDIDEQKRAQERYSFLAEASAVLSSSLDYEETLRRAAELAVPALCDWCAIDLIDGGEAPSRLIIASQDEGLRETAQAIELEEPIAEQQPLYMRVLQRGQAGLWPDVNLDMLRTMGMSERRLQLLEAGGLRSAIAAPIMVRGKPTAVLLLISARSGRRFGERDLDTAREFARHISFAVENALLYQESQRVQEELRLANETKDEFLGLMSHELRTPITTLFGGAKILRSRGRFLTDEHRESLLRDIENEAEGMHRMIEDLLVLARAGTGERVGTEPILANHLVDRVVRGFQLHRPGRQIQVHYEEDLLPIMADNTYMEQVLRNLLSNADKYSPAGLPIDVDLRLEGEEVVVSVLDRGAGIDPEEAELVFTRFYRAERTARGVRGMGLGLTVCKKLVEAQGGRIWAHPRPGGGTEVSFALPAFTASFDDTP